MAMLGGPTEGVFDYAWEVSLRWGGRPEKRKAQEEIRKAQEEIEHRYGVSNPGYQAENLAVYL